MKNHAKLNTEVYNYAKFALHMPSYGCLDQLEGCRETNRTQLADFAICAGAQSVCRDGVESIFYAVGNRNTVST